ATSANLGPGLDCLGLALTLDNYRDVEPAQTLCIEARGEGAAFIPANDSNLTYQSMLRVFEAAGRGIPPLRLVQRNALPVSRGLGSSAAGIVAGVVAANELLGGALSMAQMLELATAIEGHPDNVAPCLLGGLTASMRADARVYTRRAAVAGCWKFAALVPDFVLSTKKARAVLPDTYPRAAAVGNVARALFMYEALQDGDAAALAAASADELHQPYRSALIPGWDDVLAAAREAGADAVFLSGAGPTVMSVYRRDTAGYLPQLTRRLAALSGGWRILELDCDEQGACRV
ncbi:MAG: homoserine kinase, partial [Eubacteriales bacterium]|nr:homoserine kinase [Eubacteriales bacterium]